MDEFDQDTQWMRRALELARLGLGTTSPNPPVGAVIIKNGHVLGEGWHEKAGKPHAERCALADALQRGNAGELAGATLYVTLEPCSSWGKTPPCTDAIIEARIARVVYGSVDPDERHRGRADALLASHGIEVRNRCCEAACGLLLRPWAWSVKRRRPWVLAKAACTMDGRMTRACSQWLTDEPSVRYAHQLRLESDAILVGGNTARTDDPALTIRCSYGKTSPSKLQPWRIVLTRDRSSLSSGLKLLSDPFAERTVVLERVEDFGAMLETLYRELGIVNLMLECGGRLLRTFLEEGLVNEWVQIIVPMLAGGPDALLPGDYLSRERSFAMEATVASGRDVILRGVLS